MELNAKWMLDELRSSIDEATESHWSDAEILRKLNRSQRKIALVLSMTPGDWLVTSEDLIPSSGVITLPSLCSKPIYLEEKSTGAELPINVTVRERAESKIPGAMQDAYGPSSYLQKDAIVVNQTEYANQVTLYYELRIADLIAATGDTGSTTNTLIIPNDNNPSMRDDYYNGLYLEATGGTGVGTRALISDYVGSTRALTIAGTFSTDTEFGTVSQLPQEAIPYLLADALLTLLAKPSANIDTKYYEFALNNWREDRKLFEEWCSTRLKNTTSVRLSEDY